MLSNPSQISSACSYVRGAVCSKQPLESKNSAIPIFIPLKTFVYNEICAIATDLRTAISEVVVGSGRTGRALRQNVEIVLYGGAVLGLIAIASEQGVPLSDIGSISDLDFKINFRYTYLMQLVEDYFKKHFDSKEQVEIGPNRSKIRVIDMLATYVTRTLVPCDGSIRELTRDYSPAQTIQVKLEVVSADGVEVPYRVDLTFRPRSREHGANTVDFYCNTMEVEFNEMFPEGFVTMSASAVLSLHKCVAGFPQTCVLQHRMNRNRDFRMFLLYIYRVLRAIRKGIRVRSFAPVSPSDDACYVCMSSSASQGSLESLSLIEIACSTLFTPSCNHKLCVSCLVTLNVFESNTSCGLCRRRLGYNNDDDDFTNVPAHNESVISSLAECVPLCIFVGRTNAHIDGDGVDKSIRRVELMSDLVGRRRFESLATDSMRSVLMSIMSGFDPAMYRELLFKTPRSNYWKSIARAEEADTEWELSYPTL
jgi:hypothetical protein